MQSWLKGWEPAVLIPKQQLAKGVRLAKASPEQCGCCGVEEVVGPGWRTEVLPPWPHMGGDHPNLEMENLQGGRSANPSCWQPQGGFSSKPKEDPHVPKMEIHSQL